MLIQKSFEKSTRSKRNKTLSIVLDYINGTNRFKAELAGKLDDAELI